MFNAAVGPEKRNAVGSAVKTRRRSNGSFTSFVVILFRCRLFCSSSLSLSLSLSCRLLIFFPVHQLLLVSPGRFWVFPHLLGAVACFLFFFFAIFIHFSFHSREESWSQHSLLKGTQ